MEKGLRITARDLDRRAYRSCLVAKGERLYFRARGSSFAATVKPSRTETAITPRDFRLHFSIDSMSGSSCVTRIEPLRAQAATTKSASSWGIPFGKCFPD